MWNTYVLLQQREYAILHYLMAHAGALLTRRMIEDHVWDMSLEFGSHLLDVYVGRLRKKLGDAATIETVRGVGYRLKLNNQR